MKGVLVLAVSLALSGCGVAIPAMRSTKKLNMLEVGLERSEVIRRVGKPDAARGSYKTEGGNVVQLDQYELYHPGVPGRTLIAGLMVLTFPWWWPLGDGSPYWLAYKDGKLEQWGAAGDWQERINKHDLTIRQK